MNFWVIISYLKVKNLSRNVAPEKCKKTAKTTPSKSPWGDKNSRTTATENKQAKKRKNNLKWGLWGLLFYTAYRKPNFCYRKSE